MKKNEEVRTEPPQTPSLPKMKLNEDLTWDTEAYGIKYRLHEATIPELAAASAGARSEDEKQINLLSLVVQEQDGLGKWVPIIWPKTGGHRLYLTLNPCYYMGFALLEAEAKKSMPTLTDTSKMENSSTIASESSQKL